MRSSRSLPVANTRQVISELPNRWMLRLPRTMDRGVDTAFGCNCHYLCLWFLSVARVRSGFGMITQASGLGMGVGRVSRWLRVVGVQAMPKAGLHTMRSVESVCEVRLGAGGLWLRVPSMAVRVLIPRHCVADRVEATHWVIYAMWELFSEDEGVEFWPWIVAATELPTREESLLPAGTEMCLLAGQSREFPEFPHICWFWWFPRLWTFCTTGVMKGEGFRKA